MNYFVKLTAIFLGQVRRYKKSFSLMQTLTSMDFVFLSELYSVTCWLISINNVYLIIYLCYMWWYRCTYSNEVKSAKAQTIPFAAYASYAQAEYFQLLGLKHTLWSSPRKEKKIDYVIAAVISEHKRLMGLYRLTQIRHILER